MRGILSIAVLILVMAMPVRAGGTGEFEPDEPFREAFTKNLLRSFLAHTLEVLDDHLEITGTLGPDEAKGHRRNYLQFKFYPEGKSKSDDSITVEGWFDQSPGLGEHDFHFRFKFPEPSSEQSSEQFEHVL